MVATIRTDNEYYQQTSVTLKYAFRAKKVRTDSQYVMYCHVMLCYFMLCYIMLCYIMLYYVILYYVILCYVMLYDLIYLV
jgi:hypothetical protein